MAHKVSESAIQNMLHQADYGSNVTELPASDPITITQIILKLEQIKSYDKNPRQEINPKYDIIKESIKQQGGLTNNFNVTRRPGEELYMIQSGGNTRYTILKELYQETGDERFNTVHCLFVPWVNEATVLSHHLVENLVRGDMLFIDQAYAIAALRAELESAAGHTLSGREFEQQTKQLGFDVSRRNASRMAFAIELDQYIPCALRGGLSLTGIDKLSGYKSDCSNVIDLSKPQIEALFAHTLSTMDEKDLDIESVRNPLCEQLAQATNTTAEMIHLMMTQTPPSEQKKTESTETEAQRKSSKSTMKKKDSLEAGFLVAKALGEKEGFDTVLQQIKAKPGYKIEVGQAAPPVESALYLFVQAVANQQGVGVFGLINVLEIDDHTFDLCISLIKQCRD